MTDRQPEAPKAGWGLKILIVMIGLGLVFVVVAHLTGMIGPGLHGSSVPPTPSSTLTGKPVP